MKKVVVALALSLALTACKEDVASVVVPVEMTDDALGHYCQMFVADHPGPKAQVHLKGRAEPLWFSQVSDAVAYMHDPEREMEITAVFVSDMSHAESWSMPGIANWQAAETAFLVIESDQLGGMGVPEALPFSRREDATAFVADRGGRIVRWGDVPESYVRPAEIGMSGHAGDRELMQ